MGTGSHSLWLARPRQSAPRCVCGGGWGLSALARSCSFQTILLRHTHTHTHTHTLQNSKIQQRSFPHTCTPGQHPAKQSNLHMFNLYRAYRCIGFNLYRAYRCINLNLYRAYRCIGFNLFTAYRCIGFNLFTAYRCIRFNLYTAYRCISHTEADSHDYDYTVHTLTSVLTDLMGTSTAQTTLQSVA